MSTLPPFLTDDEIAAITAPLTQPAARCRYLRKVYGVLVKPRPNGQPVVGRAEFEAAMLSKNRQRLPEGRSELAPVIDFAALRAAKKRSVIRS